MSFSEDTTDDEPDFRQSIEYPYDQCPVCGSQELVQPVFFGDGKLNCLKCPWMGEKKSKKS